MEEKLSQRKHLCLFSCCRKIKKKNSFHTQSPLLVLTSHKEQARCTQYSGFTYFSSSENVDSNSCLRTLKRNVYELRICKCSQEPYVPSINLRCRITNVMTNNRILNELFEGGAAKGGKLQLGQARRRSNIEHLEVCSSMGFLE